MFETVEMQGGGNIDYSSNDSDTTSATITGNRGDNAITGGGSDDLIRGKKGNDTLSGGGGADMLRGGRGADDFVYLATTDSGTTNGTRDVILGFSRRDDVIDLSALSEDIRWLGTERFTESGVAELRFRKKQGDTYVMLDLDGDGTSDMDIIVADTAKLSAGDFVW